MSHSVRTRFGILGCGLIGQKRAMALGANRLAAVFDIDQNRSASLAARMGFDVASAESAEALVRDPRVDAVIISTDNRSLFALGMLCVRSGKHVLIEKPGSRSYDEFATLLGAAETAGVHVRIGYNHRFHPALQKALEISRTQELGPLMMIRARYGHGGRLGYEKEWRADPSKSGGGELIDQGVHLIDLARMFAGPLELVHGEASTLFWNMPVDDNAFLHLVNRDGVPCWLHASCTEWKNLFSFEIYYKNAKLHIEGLGGSYGVERLAFYRMLPEMGPPETTVFEYPRGDDSWRLEVEAFVEDIEQNRVPVPGAEEGLMALRIVDEVYGRRERESKISRPITVERHREENPTL